MKIELNLDLHEDTDLLCIHKKYDGQWEISLIDPFGTGHTSVATAINHDPNVALTTATTTLLKHIEDRRARTAELQARAAVNASLARAAIGPDPYPRPAPPRAPYPTPRPQLPTHNRPPATVTGWAGSVPRQAAEWHVNLDTKSVTVLLRPGLVWPDTLTDELRIHPTVRRAKDLTRAAISRPE